METPFVLSDVLESTQLWARGSGAYRLLQSSGYGGAVAPVVLHSRGRGHYYKFEHKLSEFRGRDTLSQTGIKPKSPKYGAWYL